MSIGELTALIEANQRLNEGAGSPHGYFGGMLLRLLRELDGGEIDARLVEAVGRRYLEVYDAYQAAAEDIPSVWRVCYDSAAVKSWREQLMIVQHLQLGVHAHIGYDLPVAAMDMCGGRDELSALKNDFAAYSKRVVEALERAKADIASFSPAAEVLELFGAGTMGFDAAALRKLSWRIAAMLVRPPAGREPVLILQDYNRMLTELARRIREPGEAAIPLIDFVRRFEPGGDQMLVGDAILAIEGKA